VHLIERSVDGIPSPNLVEMEKPPIDMGSVIFLLVRMLDAI
jgi:hypothetical protein